MIKNSIVIYMGSFLLLACTEANNPFRTPTGSADSVCNVDLTKRVSLERADFLPPKIWLELEPCNQVRVARNFTSGQWGISASLLSFYDDVVMQDAAAGFSVDSNLDWIGVNPPNIAKWREREDRKWKQYMKGRGSSETRKVFEEVRGELSCLRTEKKTYNNGAQSSKSVKYDCWGLSLEHLPSLTIGGWVGYWQGKPLYDWDIDKDLIDPVFVSLRLKGIPQEVYAERMQAHKEKVEAECERRIDDIRENRLRPLNAHEIERLEFCGYDTSKLVRKVE